MAIAESTGQFTQSITTVSSTMVVVASGVGRFCSLLLTSAGGNNLAGVYDWNGSSGTQRLIGAIPANSPVGTFLSFRIPFFSGISVDDFSSPAGTIVTISYSLD